MKFTTNWSLDKTHFNNISTQSQMQYYKQKAMPTGKKKKISISKNKGESRTMSFEEILLEAINDGLSLLGESGRQAVYYHLEKNFQIKKQDIPYKIEEFTDAIERIFGNGAKIIEIRIMKCIFKRVSYKFKRYMKLQNLTFIEYIIALKLALKNIENGKSNQQNTNNMQKKTLFLQIH